ncbi:MAG: hypothetical protein WBD40_19040 [Tepidisphaeraceae bacterium]
MASTLNDAYRLVMVDRVCAALVPMGFGAAILMFLSLGGLPESPTAFQQAVWDGWHGLVYVAWFVGGLQLARVGLSLAARSLQGIEAPKRSRGHREPRDARPAG